MYGGQSTYIPLKVNQSGVIPVIFASSILAFPALIASALGNNLTGVQKWINDNLVARQSWWYILFYTILIIFFAYFYTAIAFNPQQQADIIRKQGGFIPGIRPGPATEKYLAKVLNRITLPGSLFLATIAIIPLLVFALWNISSIPLRRYRSAHHRRCRARDDEADRQSAHDAQLRGFPRLSAAKAKPAKARGPRVVLLGKQGAGKGTQASRSRSTTASSTSRPARCSARPRAKGPRFGRRRAGLHGPGRARSPTLS